MASQAPTADRSAGHASPAGRSFADAVARLHADLRRDGVPFADMRRAESLELQYAGAGDLGRVSPNGDPAAAEGIRRLEGEPRIVARPVSPCARGASRLRAFLDGSQRTFPVWRFGLVPVAATVAAAAVLTRDAAGNPTIAPGTLRLAHAWLVPTRTGDPAIAALLDRLAALGARVIDPIARVAEGDDYLALANDYGKMVELAYVAARAVREEVEITLLDDWASAAIPDDGWLVVDGRLRLAVPRAVGLVKDLSNQHLAGLEAVELFGLQPGHRTTAFVPSDRRRRPDPPADVSAPRTIAPAAIDEHAPSLWYLRMHDATGLDARHALVRVEAPADVQETAAIDELSSWLLAEKTPRATADARWATLLYPVHYLEQILKRRVAADTRGWPG